MERFGAKESDLKESFIRSSGPGGQNVNKVATCVVLKHIPTGIVVKCQKDRTQVMNRYYARRRLLQKLEEQIQGKNTSEQKRNAKIRRQKRKRSKRAKEKILDQKQKHSEKKEWRRSVSGEE